MISIPIPMWSMYAFNAFAKRLIPSVAKVGLKAFEALGIDFVKKAKGRRQKVEGRNTREF
jgi:hypothetical protein